MRTLVRCITLHCLMTVNRLLTSLNLANLLTFYVSPYNRMPPESLINCNISFFLCVLLK